MSMVPRRLFILPACLLLACSTATPKPPPPPTSVVAPQEPGSKKGLSGTIAALETLLKRDGLDPELRAQAMFRLASHYDDQEREQAEKTDRAPDLSKSISIYQSLLRDYPGRFDTAAIHYFLGTALIDTGRNDEGQAVLRSLVCNNRYPYPGQTPGPASLPQDHDEAFWKAWESDQPKTETQFINPYPDDCAPLPTKTDTGREPRLVAEVWWRIGEYHFNSMDSGRAGPYSLNRAAAAYTHATRTENKLVRPLALYKLAWTQYKQQRYEVAVARFLDLLHYLDHERNNAPDLRREAITYIAVSLTFIDFRGPSADDPFIPRADVLDTEHDPAIAEQKMRVAVTRVETPSLIPQSESFTPEIYEALAFEFRELHQFHNEIDVLDRLLTRWPQYHHADALRERLAAAKRASSVKP